MSYQYDLQSYQAAPLAQPQPQHAHNPNQFINTQHGHNPQQAQHAQYGQPGQPGQYAPGQGMPNQGLAAQGGPPPFGNFFNDPAAAMGMQFTQSAFNSSNQYLTANLHLYMARSHLQTYFKVSTSYVMRKVALILFPYRHKSWSRVVETASGDASGAAFASPLKDINAPDLYLPLMAFVSYVMFGAITAGAKGKFHPEILGYTATFTLAFAIIDLLLLKLGIYLLGDANPSTPSGLAYGSLWDLIALSNYKYVSLLTIALLHTVFRLDQKFVAKWAVFAVVFLSWAVFLLRSLRDVVLPPSAATMYGSGFGNSTKGRKVKVQFLFVYCFVGEFLVFWFLH